MNFHRMKHHLTTVEYGAKIICLLGPVREMNLTVVVSTSFYLHKSSLLTLITLKFMQ